MANVATIIIEVDEKGAVRSMNNLSAQTQKLDPALQQVGKRGNFVLDDLAKHHERAALAVQLLAQSTGVQLPRSLERVIAKSPAVAGALSAAFSGAVVAAFAFQIVRLVNNFDSIQVAIERAGKEFAVFGDRLREWIGLRTTGSALEERIIQQQRLLVPLLDKEVALRNQAAMTGLEGFAAIREAGRQEIADIKRIADAQNSAAREKFGTTKAYFEAAALIKRKSDDDIAGSERKTAAQEIELRRQIGDETRKLQHEADLAGLGQISTLREKLRMDQQDLDILVARKKLTQEEADIQKKGLEAREKHEETALSLKNESEGQIARLQAEAKAATGITQIRKELEVRLAQINEDERTSELSKQAFRKAAEKESDDAIAELRRQRSEELIALETQTAIAILPPWQRADAQIVADAEERIRKIRTLMEKDKDFEQQGQREITLIWRKEMQERVENMANQLESVFDEITSGGIGQFFLKRFKHLVFEMIAAWILGMNTMRSASQQSLGSGGGILGAIFGSLGLGGIFGGGGGGGGGGQAGISQIPGVITNFGGAGLTGLGISAGGGANAAGIGLPAGAGPQGGGILGQLFSRGGKFGQLLGLGGLALLTSSIGKGGILGTLGRIGGGALLGTAIFPGIGTIIGALVGFIAGLFGQHKGDKARIEVMEPLMAQIKVVQDSYDVFQTDYNSAIGTLEAMRADAIAKLRQIGGRQVGGNTAGTNRLVDASEQHIKDIEAERQRRAQLNFGPAQFRVGGFVNPGLAAGIPAGFPANAPRFDIGGAVPAFLHPGEYVFSPEATARHGRSKLDAMNSGWGGGSGDMHITISALDSQSIEQWLRRGGSEKIAAAIRRARREGAA